MSASPLLRFGLQATIAGLVAGLLVLWVMSSDDQTSSLDQPATSSTRQPWQTSFNQAVQQAGPGVVNIYSSKTIKRRLHPLLDNPLFQQFFGGPQVPRERIQSSLGSGVLVSADGYVLTNNHVIAGADEIKVALNDGRSAQAQLIGSDPGTDLALLEIDLPDLTSLRFGQSDQLLVGDVVLAIGNPFGVGQTVTMGIVSATGRTQLGINTFENFIQTDAAINPGNSGGALVDAYGRLIGINTAIFSRSGGSQGVGFAIPSKMAKNIMEQLIKHGHAVRGWLGFEGHALTPKLVESLELDTTEGIIITAIVRNSPAHKAGLEPGDIIAGVDDIKVKSGHDALSVISGKKPGEKVTLKIKRDGRQYSVIATTIARPAQAISEVNN